MTDKAWGTSQLINTGGGGGGGGNQYSIAYLYQWSPTTPGDPNSDSTFNWATGTNGTYTGTNYWQTVIPTNPGTPGLLLWVAQKSVTAPYGTTDTLVSWASGFSIVAVSQNGTGGGGVTGVQSSQPVCYQWAASIPSSPSGSATYTWASGAISYIPGPWAATPGTSPSPGYTLWGALVSLVDSAASTTTTFNWSSASIAALGYAGNNGAVGPTGAAGPGGTNGNSYRLGYAKVTGSSLNVTPTTYTTSGSSSFPPTNTWGGGEVWQGTVPTFVAGESVFQVDGVYAPSTGNTVWGVPYLSSLKVGSLSAITTNTGSLNVTGTVTAGSTPAISGTTMTGSGAAIYSSGQFAIGNSTGNMTYNGSALTLNGQVVLPNNLSSGEFSNGTSSGAHISMGTSTTRVGLYQVSFNVNKTAVNSNLIGISAQNGYDGAVCIWGAAYNQAAPGPGGGGGVTGSATTDNTLASWQMIGALGCNDQWAGVWGLTYNKFTTTSAGIFLRLNNDNSQDFTLGVIILKKAYLCTNAYSYYSPTGGGKIYVVDGNGPFTGFHEGILPIDAEVSQGDIVVDTEVFYRHDISNVLFSVLPSSSANQKRVVGVVSQVQAIQPSVPGVLWPMENDPDSSASPPRQIATLRPEFDLAVLEATCKVAHINAVGEGQINVCGEGGAIEAGDLVVTSSMPGKGMKQSDDIVRSISVAKARESVSFSSPSEVKQIACIYISG